jgi:hypothetical protein
MLENVARGSGKSVTLPSDGLEYELLKAYVANFPKKKEGNLPKKFQHAGSDTFVIHAETNENKPVRTLGPQDPNEVYRFFGRIKRKKLNQIITKHPYAKVLVDLGNGLNKRVPIRIFKKLLQIKFIIFERDYEFCSPDEHESESMNVVWEAPPEIIKEYIYSINQLLYVLTVESSYDKAVENFLLSKFFLLVGQEKTLKIMYQNGKCEKMKLDAFLTEYGINVDVNFNRIWDKQGRWS